jgi:hypothetical protein
VNLKRILSVYNGASEELEEFFVLKDVSLVLLIDQFGVDPLADPEMLKRYAVGPDDVEFLSEYLTEALEFNFSDCGYFVEAVYDDLSN